MLYSHQSEELDTLNGESQVILYDEGQKYADDKFYEASKSISKVETSSESFELKPTGKLLFKKKHSSFPEAEDPATIIIEAKRAEKEQVNASLSLEATNELRIKLGLKPLKR